MKSISTMSEWQAISFIKGVLIIAMAFFSFGASFLALVSAIWMPGTIVAILAVGFASLFLACCLAYRWAYRRSYDMKEEPVKLRAPDGSERRWIRAVVPDPSQGLPGKVKAYEQEFLLNALVNPRRVFSRITEYVTPGRRMLDCSVHFEVQAPDQQDLRILGLNDVPAEYRTAEETAGCELIVPVAFQERGGLTISQTVSNASGRDMPIVKQEDFTEMVISMVERYFKGVRHPDKFTSDLRDDLRGYLKNTELNPDTSVPERLCAEMFLVKQTETDESCCRAVLRMLVGLRDVIPLCVSIHVVAIPMERGGEEWVHDPVDRIPRVFKLRMEEKREMVAKPTDVVPNLRGSRAVELVNKVLRMGAHQGETIYYNIANAGRSTSYHLHVEGPENTYYARGSLLRENKGDRRLIYAEQVEMQKRCGQRNAHIYIRSGHRMVNTTFMFRFRKAPLDSYHIMFIAALLCVAVLAVCVMGSLCNLGRSANAPGLAGILSACDGSGSSSGLSTVSMLLAVVSAAGSWIYGRAWDGREDSAGIKASVVSTVGCSVSGMLFNAAVVSGVFPNEAAGDVGLAIWCMILSVMLCTMVLVGYMALLHGSIYRYLLAKDPNGRNGDDGDVVEEPSGAVGDGIRRDTPSGRYTTNDYCLWKKSMREFERRCGLYGEE